jgi:hypothetical protein
VNVLTNPSIAHLWDERERGREKEIEIKGEECKNQSTQH